MKNLIKFFVPAAAAALALVSCQKEQAVPGENTVRISVKAVASELLAQDDTKTYIDNYDGTPNTILWGTDEYMRIALTTDGTTHFANSTDATASAFEGEPQGYFEFSVADPGAESYVYQGLYPASAAVVSSNTNAENFKVRLPDIQNATASSYDPAAYIMVAQPESFDAIQLEWMASFRRATALNKVTLNGIEDDIISVSFTAAGADGTPIVLAGARHINLATGESTDIYDGVNNVSVKYEEALTGTGKVVWFTTWGAEIPEGATLTIVARASNKAYTRELTARPQGILFKEGYLNTLSVNMASADVQDVDPLEGDFAILAKNGENYYALVGEPESEGVTRLGFVNYNRSLTHFEGGSNCIWTITASGNSYTIKNGDNYLAWNGGNGSKANNAVLIADEDYDEDKCLLGIDENADGTYKIYVAATPTRILAKNTTSNIGFAFYAGTQYNTLVLVPASGAMETVEAPTFDPEAGAVASGTQVTISTATPGAAVYYTTDGTDPTTSSTQGNIVTITKATTIKAYAVKDGMLDSEIVSVHYTIEGVTDYPGIQTSNVGLSAGNNAQAATVNGYDAVKVGTSNKAGEMTISVPAGTTKLHLHVAAWNGSSNMTVTISDEYEETLFEIQPVADSGITGDSPFTLIGLPEDYYFELSLSGISEDTELTLTAPKKNRFVVWGVNAE